MYNVDVQQCKCSGSNHVHGIKFSSPFNSLNFFHVCQPGMPPCIAHNLFEGIISYDVPLLIKHLIHKRWFTWST